jgi:hypothetical protein
MGVHRRVRGATLAVAACVGSLAVLLGSSVATAETPTPAVRPATGGGGVAVLPGFTAFDLADVGYQQSEVILSGTATAYQPTAPLGDDGRYSVEPASTAPYTTRAVVVRPVEQRRFNGTVIVEWLNVSGGADAGADWMLAHNELVREGFTWVGVSAQKVGVDALRTGAPVGGVPTGDPVRYAELSHPGDSYSYDIFSQAGQAIRDEARTVLGGLRPQHVIAVGESQSAGRLSTYIDAVHPVAHVYDGYLVHSRGLLGAPLSQAPQADVPIPSTAPFRTDLDVPVLSFQTETDAALSNFTARQPDSRLFRLWEVAGTAHYDLYGLKIGLTDTGDGQAGAAVLDSMLHPTNQPNDTFTCAAPINTGLAHYVLDAAFYWINRWVADGVRPPTAPRLQTTATTPATLATDEHGNALGGIRTPAVDAPVATVSGLPAPGGTTFCFIFGTTTPFSPEKLAELYPSHGRFVAAWARSTFSAYAAGFLTPADTLELLLAAGRSSIGG